MIHVPKCVSALCNLTAAQSARYSMTGVRVKEYAGGFFRLEATDGRVLGIIRGPSNPSDEDLRAAERLPEPQTLLLEALLPTPEFTAALKAVPKAKLHPKKDRALGVVLARPDILLVAGDTVSRCQPLDGRFPDVDVVLPRTPAPVSFRVNAEYLIDILKAAVAVARTQDDSRSVELLYWSHGQPVGVVAQGAGGLTFDGLIMPLVESGPTPR